jgi:RHS repeat-associated protein
LNGSEISKITAGADSITYNWDLANRLSGAAINRVQNDQPVAITTAYKYDSDGIRTRSDSTTTTGGILTDQQTEIDLVDKDNPTGYAQVLEEFNAQQLLTAMTHYGLEPISQFRNGAESFYHMDGHSGVRLLTAGTGIVVSAVVYDAYGQLLRAVGNSLNPVLYRGERLDPILTQYYLRARFYDQATGRFTKVDQFPGVLTGSMSLHRYLYAQDDSVNGMDPSGQFTLTEAVVVLAIVTTLLAVLYGAYLKWTYVPAPSLSVTRVFFASGRNGGSYLSAVNFELDRPSDPTRGGWILQHVVRKATDARTGDVAAQGFDFWEAFRVQPNQKFPARNAPAPEFIQQLQTIGINAQGVVANDYFANEGYPNSSGRILQSGEIYYLDQMDDSDLPASWTTKAVQFAGGLHAKYTGIGAGVDAKRLMGQFPTSALRLHTIEGTWTLQNPNTAWVVNDP